VHRHHDEDEYSYVLEGTLGALLGDDIVSLAAAPRPAGQGRLARPGQPVDQDGNGRGRGSGDLAGHSRALRTP
jgi:hypothetical protein